MLGLICALAAQVMWGLTPGGPYPNNATGYARGYVQVGGLNLSLFLADGGRQLTCTFLELEVWTEPVLILRRTCTTATPTCRACSTTFTCLESLMEPQSTTSTALCSLLSSQPAAMHRCPDGACRLPQGLPACIWAAAAEPCACMRAVQVR